MLFTYSQRLKLYSQIYKSYFSVLQKFLVVQFPDIDVTKWLLAILAPVAASAFLSTCPLAFWLCGGNCLLHNFYIYFILSFFKSQDLHAISKHLVVLRCMGRIFLLSKKRLTAYQEISKMHKDLVLRAIAMTWQVWVLFLPNIRKNTFALRSV